MYYDPRYDGAMFEISQISDGFLRVCAYMGERKVIISKHGRIPTRLRTRARWRGPRGCFSYTATLSTQNRRKTEGKVPILHQHCKSQYESGTNQEPGKFRERHRLPVPSWSRVMDQELES